MTSELRRWIALVEGRDAPLYHGTSVKKAISILQAGRVKANTEHFVPPRSHNIVKGISLSRSLRTAKSWGKVVFVFDQAKIAQRQQILPIDYWQSYPMKVDWSDKIHRRTHEEAEEFVVGDLVLASSLTRILFDAYTVRNDAGHDRIDDADIRLLIDHPLAN